MPRAFTIVELLVVISIIVVLLALLAPAMDRAIYAAELTRCGAQVHGIALAAVTRATEYKRQYPYRRAIHVDHQQQSHLRFNTTDDRAAMLPYYLRYDWLTCPLTGKPLDIEKSTLDQVRSTYLLWYGFAIYKSGAPTTHHGAMAKLGDRWGFQERQFSVIASDWDFREEQAAPRANSSHPDREGRMVLARYPNTVQPTWLHARWELTGNYKRPPVDLNFGYQDLAVERLDGLNWDDVKEDRTVSVPHRGGDTDWLVGWQNFVPPK